MNSTNRLMTKLKMITDRGSPWKIPICKGNGLVVQVLETTTANRLEYMIRMSRVNEVGRW